jgi:hypothetical protein
MEEKQSTELLRRDVVVAVIEKLSQLHTFLSSPMSHRFNFYSSSILIAFEGSTPLTSFHTSSSSPPTDTHFTPVVVRMIDFQHVFEKKEGSAVFHEDDGFLLGIRSILDILQELLHTSQ